MNNAAPQNSATSDALNRKRWLLGMAAGCVLVGVFLLVSRRSHNERGANGLLTNSVAQVIQTEATNAKQAHQRFRRSSLSPSTETPEEIVARKVAQFGRSRREIVKRIAERTKKRIPAEVEAFFDAVEEGDWDKIHASWDFLAKRSSQYEGSTSWEELNPFWSAVLDAYGVAEQAHLWPAQKLLDYGNAILDSLRPGMVYVGGTDNGRWVPELLNETSGGEPHIIVTQNALADGRYLEYMRELYGERFSALTSEDSERAFKEYTADAQKRLEHDQQFPDEPKQLHPGEEVRMVDGKVQVSGIVAVMAINERLLQTMMQKNPDLSFAIQESFPLRGTYADALPLGPLMELRAQNGQNTFTAERAAQSLEYWRNAAQQILSDPEAIASDATLKSYSHDAVSAANLLAAHNFANEAEQSYRLGSQLWPQNPESIAGLADLLTANGRANEAQQLMDDFKKKYPERWKDMERARARVTFVYSGKPKP